MKLLSVIQSAFIATMALLLSIAKGCQCVIKDSQPGSVVTINEFSVTNVLLGIVVAELVIYAIVSFAFYAEKIE